LAKLNILISDDKHANKHGGFQLERPQECKEKDNPQDLGKWDMKVQTKAIVASAYF
jgi:hypothetical protein